MAKTLVQILSMAGEEEDKAFQLFERHYRNSIRSWKRILKVREKIKRIEKKIQEESINESGQA